MWKWGVSLLKRKGNDMTNKELAQKLFTTTDAIKAAAGRNHWDGEWDVNTELNEGQQTQALSYFAQHNKKRKLETTEAAAALLVELGLKEAPQQPTIRQRIETLKPTNAYEFILFSVLMLVMLFQMHHTSYLFEVMEKNGYGWTWGWVAAIAIQFTGSLMTVASGSKNWLLIFSFVEFKINMLYYSPWETATTYTQGSSTVVGSFLIAFALFAYNHLFTELRKEKHHV